MKKAVAVLVFALTLAVMMPVFAQEEMADQTMTEETNQINAVTGQTEESTGMTEEQGAEQEAAPETKTE